MPNYFTSNSTWKCEKKHTRSHRDSQLPQLLVESNFNAQWHDQRKHFQDFRPSTNSKLSRKKCLGSPSDSGPKATGIRQVPQIKRNKSLSMGVRIIERPVTVQNEILIETRMGRKKRNEFLSSSFSGQEYNIESEFCRKQRGYTFDKKRNGINAAKFGDKNYPVVELSDRFFSKSNSNLLCQWSPLKTRQSPSKKPSYELIQRTKEYILEKKNVAQLTTSSSDSKSWEQITGRLTWPKKEIPQDVPETTPPAKKK